MIRRLSFLSLILFLILTGCQRTELVQESRLMMDTIVSIKAPHSSQNNVRPAIEGAFSRMEEIEKLMNKYDQDSECARINRLRPGDEIEISPEVASVLKKAHELNRITEGAFDITVSPLVDLWDFYKGKDEIPTSEEVKAVLTRVGKRKLILNDRVVSFTQDGITIDLSSIAKGFAVDEAIRALKESGIENGLVDAGGDIYCLGSGPDKKGWRVGIRHPRKKEFLGSLILKDRAVATSGDYEKFFIVGENRYSHILDPRSGYPVSDLPMSVTVVASDCITADGLATAISVLGPRDGLRFAEGLDGVEALVVSRGKRDLKVDMTSGLKKIYEGL